MTIKAKNTTIADFHEAKVSASAEDFKNRIAEAEKGPFFSIEESKKKLEEWRKQRDSQ